jgi:response regulator RpfG family c-di-GMP phosphodiesterase
LIAKSAPPCPLGKAGMLPTDRPTILFVDDEERILRSLRMLFAASYRVLMTTNGHEALEILRKERVHVLVSDQRMPVMTGVELLRQARECSPPSMRLLLTGYSDMEAIIGSINEGEIFRYINKPWNAEDFRRTVGEAMDIAIKLWDPAPVEAPPPAPDEILEILLLDDSPEVAVAIRALLDENFLGAYHLDWATSQAEAMTILERGKVSIIVSETRVDGEDVTPFLKTLKHFHAQIVTIVLTSFSDTSLLTDLINQGQIHRFLPKPMRKTLTVRSIRSGIDRHREIVQRPQLSLRHRVESPRATVNHSMISRIRGIFHRVSI